MAPIITEIYATGSEALSANPLSICAGLDQVFACDYTMPIWAYGLTGAAAPFYCDGPSDAEDLCIGPDGNFWAVSAFAGGRLAKVLYAAPHTPSYPGVSASQSVCVGPDDNIWCTSGSHVYCVNPSTGSVIHSIAISGITSGVSNGPAGTDPVTHLSIPYMYVVAGSAEVYQINVATGTATAITGAVFSPGVRDLCQGPDGNLYASVSSLGIYPSVYSGVWQITEAGAVTFYPCCLATGSSGVFYGICGDSTDNVWVGDRSGGCAWSVSCSTGEATQYLLAGGPFPNTDYSQPQAVCLGPDKNIYVLDNRIVVPPGGVLTTARIFQIGFPRGGWFVGSIGMG